VFYITKTKHLRRQSTKLNSTDRPLNQLDNHHNIVGVDNHEIVFFSQEAQKNPSYVVRVDQTKMT